jgi:hypothetical protein
MNKLITTISATVPAAGLPDPVPDWNFIGTNAGIEVYNGIYAIVLILCGIALLVGGILIAFGKLGQHGAAFVGGLWTVGCAVGVAALASGAAVLINFGGSLNLSS